MKPEEKKNWKLAVEEEMNSMHKNNVWNLVNEPTLMSDGPSANILDSRWIFKRKIAKDGTTKFKTKLVIRGFQDNNEYELKETYVPVVRLPLVRAVYAIINKLNLEEVQLNVKTAFLNGNLTEEMYTRIPDGIKCDESTKRIKVCRPCSVGFKGATEYRHHLKWFANVRRCVPCGGTPESKPFLRYEDLQRCITWKFQVRSNTLDARSGRELSYALTVGFKGASE